METSFSNLICYISVTLLLILIICYYFVWHSYSSHLLCFWFVLWVHGVIDYYYGVYWVIFLRFYKNFWLDGSVICHHFVVSKLHLQIFRQTFNKAWSDLNFKIDSYHVSLYCCLLKVLLTFKFNFITFHLDLR